MVGADLRVAHYTLLTMCLSTYGQYLLITENGHTAARSYTSHPSLDRRGSPVHIDELFPAFVVLDACVREVGCNSSSRIICGCEEEVSGVDIGKENFVAIDVIDGARTVQQRCYEMSCSTTNYASRPGLTCNQSA